jgi:hypothetical protein
MIDTVPPHEDRPTEDDLEVLTSGIPISHLPVLGRWPSGPTTSSSGAGTPTGESFSPAPSA